jgi:hypothetical protein
MADTKRIAQQHKRVEGERESARAAKSRDKLRNCVSHLSTVIMKT